MNLKLLSMELILLATGVLLIALNIAGVRKGRILGYFALFGIVLDALAGFFLLYGKDTFLNAAGGALFKGSLFLVDPLALYFKELFCLILFMAVLISMDYFDRNPALSGEYYGLLAFAGTGMLMMASAGDFLLLFISMELISIPLYILSAFNKNSKSSSEAGLKYCILGALASALFLYGVSLLYGNSGTLFFLKHGPDASSPLSNAGTFAPSFSGLFMIGLVLITAGLGFKIAAAPFHMWAPDVYEGAPPPVAAFISVGPKVAGLSVLMRFLLGGLDSLLPVWAPLISILAAMSIIIGNLSALRQDNIKRLLAYSGISQIGYILLGFVGVSGGRPEAMAAVLFYIALYAVTNLGAFAAAISCIDHYKSESIRDFKGLYQNSPALAFMLALIMLSLAGVPPLSGFIGKFYLFLSAFNAFDHRLAGFVALAILFSVISLFYYLRVIRYTFIEEPAESRPFVISGPFSVALSISVLTVVFIGFIPSMHQLMLYLSRFI